MIRRMNDGRVEDHHRQILPFWYGLQAQAYAEVGRAEAGAVAVREALTLAEQNDERHGEAELHRIGGDLLAATGGDDAAVEAAFRRALDVAAAQRARAWTLRSAISLCRFLRARGRASEGRAVLAAARAEVGAGAREGDVVEADRLLG
ncbi:MAG: hypothetical protein ACREQL_06635 [Candidatus Binatia bacterium]